MVVLWILIGVALGAIAMTPVVRLLLRRGEHRARLAERRARESERLAELGAMTGGLAHEIKNPLSTIGLNAQLLTEGLQDAELRDDQRDRLLNRLDALAREVERLTAILTDFLQFAGRMRLDPQPVDLVELIEELADFFHPQCDQAGITMRTQLPDEPVRVAVDEGLFKQALLNLMINAVQAMTTDGPAGSASANGSGRARELHLKVEEDGDLARVSVIDTGPGIDAPRLEQIFHPYVSHKPSGTGLGLPTARRIVEEHGGRLTATSEPGRGSQFVLELPRG